MPTTSSNSSTRFSRSAGVPDTVYIQRFANALRDRATRTQRCIGILENNLHPGPLGEHLVAPQMSDVHAVENDPSGRRFLQPQYGSSQRRLAASGLTDESQRSPGLQ